jgi:tetrapyrrole methylase family protein/MazG family protein
LKPGKADSPAFPLEWEHGVEKGISVIGLGPGDANLLTREAWDALSGATELYVRTALHPVVDALPDQLEIKSFDSFYEELDSFEAVYAAIVDRLVELAGKSSPILYGVPGDPTVGEATVAALRSQAEEHGIAFRVIHGVSFCEPCLNLLGLDALDGLYIADALELAARHHPMFHPDSPALIGQLYDRMVAADVKLTLMNQYPDEHRVVLLHESGTANTSVEELLLHQIDQSERIGSLTSLFIPALEKSSAVESFQETVARLRAPGGCPWDREQTHQSLRPHLMEEAYEVLNALDNEDMPSLCEELGDLLLQIILHAQIATEAGTFTMADVVAHVQEKIIRRHPHVFAGLDVEDVDQVLHNWESLKAAEREEHEEDKGLLDGIPQNFPALSQAAEIQERVVRVGFDWPDIAGVIDKVQEEMQEVAQAETLAEQTGEIGDLLFAVVNYARWLDVDPEAALREANLRFRKRFRQVERDTTNQELDLREMTLEELESLWEAAKSKGE